MTTTQTAPHLNTFAKIWREIKRPFVMAFRKLILFNQRKIIANAPIVHIMFNDKFNKPFVDFLNRNFDPHQHLILCKRTSNCIARPFPVGENVIEIESIQHIDLRSPKIEKIICHSLFMGDLVDKLYAEPELLKKAYWKFWGGDLYNAPRDEKNDFVRGNFKAYIANIDQELIKQRYKATGKFFGGFYQNMGDANILSQVQINPQQKVRIQINNSADATTLEMLEVLAKFKDEDIIITTVVAYGSAHQEAIIKKGIEIFGNKFQYLDKMLDFKDYAQHLANNTIFIACHNRPQGYGNVALSVALGVKVFVKKEISTYRLLESFGVVVYDTNELINMSFSDFICYGEEEKQNNIKNIICKQYDLASYVKDWQTIFNDV